MHLPKHAAPRPWGPRKSAIAVFLLAAAGLSHADSAPPESALFINEKGYVGIGTNTPGKNLDVNGIIAAQDVILQGNEPASVKELLESIKAAISRQVPVGTVVAYGGDASKQAVKDKLLKQGWLVCDGAAYKKAEFGDLYEAIEQLFGDGGFVDTPPGQWVKSSGMDFNVPDMRGRFIRGVNSGFTNRDSDATLRQKWRSGTAYPSVFDAGDVVGSLQDDAFKTHKHELSNTVHVHNRSFDGSRWGANTLQNSGDVWVSDTKVTGDRETRPKNISMYWIIKAKP